MTPRRPTRLPTGLDFVIVSVATLMISVVVGLPAPLNPIYEDRYGIAPAVFTSAFAVYVVCAAVSMLVCGRLSDVWGRRPVSTISLLFSLASCLAFLLVRDPATFIVARALAGVGVGIGMSALGAYVVDLAPARLSWLAALVSSAAAPLGVAAGALASGALVQFAPHPTRLGFLLASLLVLLSMVGVWVTPETVGAAERRARRSAGGPLVPRVAVPRRLRVVFVGGCLCFVSCWSLGGLFQSLGATIARDTLGLHGALVQGAIASAVIGTSVIGGLAAGRLPNRAALMLGVGCFVVGVAAVATTMRAENGTAFLASCMLAGIGFGAGFNACMRVLLDSATSAETAGVLSAVYLVGFLGSAAPNAAAGAAANRLGLFDVVTAYAVGTGLLVLIAGLIVGRSSSPVHTPCQAGPAP